MVAPRGRSSVLSKKRNAAQGSRPISKAPGKVAKSPRSAPKTPPGKKSPRSSTKSDKSVWRSRAPAPTSPRAPASPDFPPEEFHSPVEVPASPAALITEILKTKDVERILRYNSLLCRNRINPEYLEDLLRLRGSTLWLVRDSRRVVFGFGITHPLDRTFMSLDLICAMVRKREGTALFHSILSYCQKRGMNMKLMPIDAKVGRLYLEEAQARNFLVKRLRYGHATSARIMHFPLDWNYDADTMVIYTQ